MSQVKIFGLRAHLGGITRQVSDVIHSCVVEALQYPVGKRAHRVFLFEKSEFFYPVGRSDKFEGRSVQAKKKLIRLLFQRFEESLGVTPNDLEMTIFETPANNWGFRGLPGDEQRLDYKVEV